jgi:glycyl-tRNA synthetase (class II)
LEFPKSRDKLGKRYLKTGVIGRPFSPIVDKTGVLDLDNAIVLIMYDLDSIRQSRILENEFRQVPAGLIIEALKDIHKGGDLESPIP